MYYWKVMERPSQLPSRNTYRDDYNALIFNGKKNPSVPLDMGRYGDYAPHTVEYQIYRGEATDSSYGNHSHTKIAPLVTKITYIKMDPLDRIRNGFANPSPYNLYIYSHTLIYIIYSHTT